MSKSYRKSPFIGMAGDHSEKKNKRWANRVFRRMVREALKKEKEPVFDVRQVSNAATFHIDGKCLILPEYYDSLLEYRKEMQK